MLQRWLSFQLKGKALKQPPHIQLAGVEESRPQAVASKPVSWARVSRLWFVSNKRGKSFHYEVVRIKKIKETLRTVPAKQ